uniref:Uncharacterized protein n=1 Tax=Branchiostoma floridae TaxID=7739 RepID=C4A106_BRAFL|eukprot:XP_002585509.1 hypothetical protein BRAFLDRAFT_111927 [Branchiostoma floridae]
MAGHGLSSDSFLSNRSPGWKGREMGPVLEEVSTLPVSASPACRYPPPQPAGTPLPSLPVPPPLPSLPIPPPQPADTTSPACRYHLPSLPVPPPQPAGTPSPACRYHLPSLPVPPPQPAGTPSPACRYPLPSLPIPPPQPAGTTSPACRYPLPACRYPPPQPGTVPWTRHVGVHIYLQADGREHGGKIHPISATCRLLPARTDCWLLTSPPHVKVTVNDGGHVCAGSRSAGGTSVQGCN